VPKTKAKPVEVGAVPNEVILEPFTKIMRFGKIQYEVQRVVMGGIAGFLFGEDKPQKDAWYKTTAAMKNRTTLLQLASQIHSYLDGTVSEFADIDDYVFRVLTRVRINTTDGRIVGNPTFDVDIFKHFGKVTAKGKEMKESIPVTFLYGTNDEVTWPKVNSLLTKAVHEFKAVEYLPYKNATSAPADMRAKAAKTPTLIVKGVSYAVKLKIEKDGTNYFYIEDGADEVRIEDDKDLVVFLSKRSGLKPEILGGATVFESADKARNEIKQIQAKIDKDSEDEAEEVDLVKSLGIEGALQGLEDALSPLRKKHLAEEAALELADLNEQLSDCKKRYETVNVEYQVAMEGLANLEKKTEKPGLTNEQYYAERWKIQTSKVTAREQLVKLQALLRGKLAAEVSAFVKNMAASKVEK
jgi:hypothetical protein